MDIIRYAKYLMTMMMLLLLDPPFSFSRECIPNRCRLRSIRSFLQWFL